MSDSGPLSDISISSQSKVRISDLAAAFQGKFPSGLKVLKRQNRNAKKAIIKGKEHASSTVAEHTEVVSV
ncbi:hypothetical protein V496_02951 [Pseudogymnoascus sp. VKM F-4515 (FW-2607)]|nr:hypothetical protein V496_02951 [Pseudogymnoascus sp. VKM F-4515 (FW-2607)]KFY98280.1 hypothetical protein V498_01545 [Pseudogymnoascus sp. VKM F-4517 (FW-2822)]